MLKLPGSWLTKKIKKLMYSSHAKELVKSRDLRNVVENCQLWFLGDTVKWRGSGSVEYDRPPNFRMVVLSFGFKK